MKLPRTFLLAVLLPLAGAGAIRPVDPAKGMVLTNALVRMEFEPGTMGLATLLDRDTQVNHIAKLPEDGKHLLWEVAFQKGTQIQRVTNLTKPCSMAWVEELPGGDQKAVLEWNDQRFWKENGILTVHAEIELPQDSGIARWRVLVENRSDYWGLSTVTFPLVNGTPEAGKYDLARPTVSTGGNLLKAWSGKIEARYPSGGWPMQFCSLARGKGALYLGTQDPNARAKDFLLESAAPGRLGVVHYVDNMGVAGSDYPDYYAVELGVHRGNWVQSALHYRQWALQQKWASAGPLSRRVDMPDAIKNIGLWMIDHWLWQNRDGTVAQQNQPLIEAQKQMGVPMGMHWYNWHHMPFDNEYPHYFPAKSGFRERVKDLTSRGLLIMPYINGSSADLSIPDWPRFGPHAILDEAGGYRMSFYGEASGRLLAMCPSQEMWRQTIAGLVDRLVGEEGVNGVYVDQVSAMQADLCFAKNHGHPLGGGSYWTEGYRDEMRKVRNAARGKNRGAVITSENTDEVFFDLVDANLTWAHPTDEEIPLIQVVYSGYTLFFGSPVDISKSDRFFNYAQGQALINGRQNGWMGFELFAPEHKAKQDYLRQCGQYHVAAKKFVTFGRLWGPLEPRKPIAQFEDDGWGPWGKKHRGKVPVAEARLWQSEDGHLGVFFANYVDEPVTFPWQLNTEDYGLRQANLRLTEVTPEGAKFIGPTGTLVTRNETLAPRSIRLIEIAPESDFAFHDDQATGLQLTEAGKPVFTYNYGMLRRRGAPEPMRRSSYIYPFYTPSGVQVGDDFNPNHDHHRGIAWTWSVVAVGGKSYDMWGVKGIHQKFEKWTAREVADGYAKLGVTNGWYIDESGKRVAQEDVEVTVHPAKNQARQLDFALRFEAAGQPVEIAGTTEGKKGFGGFYLKFAPRDEGPAGTLIRTDRGVMEKDGVMAPARWAEIWGSVAGHDAGARVEDLAPNPGFPNNGWLMRHFLGILNVSWPGMPHYTLKPGKPLLLKYRVTLFDGKPAATAE
ncbi:MAG: PmoA family protein [Bryobacterales bacterium]|nr:PmoA family protein [Bryobacterales bacterium]